MQAELGAHWSFQKKDPVRVPPEWGLQFFFFAGLYGDPLLMDSTRSSPTNNGRRAHKPSCSQQSLLRRLEGTEPGFCILLVAVIHLSSK